MHRSRRRRAALAALPFLAALSSLPLAAQGVPIPYAEDYALALDRKAALEQLVPGTDDYYFYHCLDAQHRGAFREVQPLLSAWIQRHGRSARVEEIENRQALMTYGQNPAATLAFLRQRLGLDFRAERPTQDAARALPTALDPALLAVAALNERAMQLHPGSLDGFRPAALPRLAGTGLSDQQLAQLLDRLPRPDVPNLVELVARELRRQDSRGFGALAVHSKMLLQQLEELIALVPDVLGDKDFVDVYLRRLRPDEDVLLEHDFAARGEYLGRLWTFAQRLPAAHNPLKSHVLFHLLQHELARGEVVKEHLIAFLRLPRPAPWVHPVLLRSARREEIVDRAVEYPTGLTVVPDVEATVRAALAWFFAREDSYAAFSQYVQEDWLRRLFAETKILLGQGEMERWVSLLNDPLYFEQLEKRVVIGFPPTQPNYFAATAPVRLDVDVKNVPKLLVKVFHIDAYGWLRRTGKEVDASIELDGVVPNVEWTQEYTEPALRLVRRTFDFPTLTAPGTYIVEFVGNGVASRAVVQKGRLQPVARVGAAGHVLRVLDEEGTFVRDAVALVGGVEYAPDQDGEIVVPFQVRAVQDLVLRRGSLATLHRFLRLDEQYRLTAGAFVPRESLVAGRVARILVHPTLLLQGQRIAPELLLEPELVITFRDRNGVEVADTVRGPKLVDNREFVHEIRTPDNLAMLTVMLRGKVEHLGRREKVDLATEPVVFEVNGVDATARTASAVLGRDPQGFYVAIRGKNGEPRPGRAVELQLELRDYTDPLQVSLRTDDAGRCRLGALRGVTSVRVLDLPAEVGAFPLETALRTWPTSLHGLAGVTLRAPYLGEAKVARPELISLLEVRDGAYVRDAFSKVVLERGVLELRDLEAGDYELWLAEAGERIFVRVTAGERRADLAVGRFRALPLDLAAPLHVEAVETGDQEVVVRLGNAGRTARVHVFATRWQLAFDPIAQLRPYAPPLGAPLPVVRGETTYHSGRAISDEYRYILDRRYAPHFPGNMLERPGILLNPWALEETATGVGLGGDAGGAFGGRGRRGGGVGGPATGSADRGVVATPMAFASLDFLPQGSVLLANLAPDASGVVRIPRQDLGNGHVLHVVAVDEDEAVLATAVTPERPLEPRDLRLKNGLDPAQHFAEQRAIEYVAAGGEATIADARSAKFEVYDSLASVYRLFQSLSGDGELPKFAFVLQWPQLSPQQKLDHYSRFACHELHFFLHQKDREFFDAVVRPYLANKVHPTFLDDWLLERDLTAYLEPWRFGLLNVVERILLARRIPEQRETIARLVRELHQANPPQPDTQTLLFAAALRGRELERLGTLTLDGFAELERLKQEDKDVRLAEKAAAPEPAQNAAPATPKPQAGAPGRPADPRRADREQQEMQAGEGRNEELRDEDAKRRANTRAVYLPPDRTRAYAESNYWHLPFASQDGDLITADAFWADYAAHRPGTPFVSSHVTSAAGNFAEMMFALAVLDLPFTAAAPQITRDDARITLRGAGPFLVVKREVRLAPMAAGESPILIGQGFFRLGDRYRIVDGQRVDNFVTDEFVVDVAYGSQVVVTNPTSTPQRIEVLLQIPRGAIPVNGSAVTQSREVALGPFSTQSFEYAFYFPGAGDFLHYPAHVSREGATVAAAEAVTLHVVAEATKVDTRSWEHVAAFAEPAAVIEYLQQHSLVQLDLDRIAWRMRDREFFDRVIALLRDRHVFSPTLWSYGLLHGDTAVAREYLRANDAFVASCGKALVSPLLVIEAIERRFWQQIEYRPLFHSRAHEFAAREEILNRDLAAQYIELCHILAHVPVLDSEDWLTVTYYLLLQGRIAEGLAAFARVDPARVVGGRLQYDYFLAYCDFYSDDHAVARRVAERHQDHPVERWRTLFREVLAQLDEAEGRVGPGFGEGPVQPLATEPVLELAIEGDNVVLRHRNLARVEVRYHRLDVEFAFSAAPFGSQGDFKVPVEPLRADVLALAGDRPQTAFELPAAFRDGGVLVEVRGGGVVRQATRFASAIAVQTVESFGQLQVARAADRRPVPKAYVKVYARMPNGEVRFHKDGYTDLRGRFDYASVSATDTHGADRFAILVLDEQLGAVIRDVQPPVQ